MLIAIDDEAVFNLKLLSDVVFGVEQFVGTLVVETNPRGQTTNTFFATSHEY